MPNPSIAQLQRAIQIQEQIEKLEMEFRAVLGGGDVAAPVKTESLVKPVKTKRTVSPATIAKMRAAQQARWAKSKGTSTLTAKAAASIEPKPAAKVPNKGGLTAEGRAKLAAAMKARWAARKKGAPVLNAPKKQKQRG